MPDHSGVPLRHLSTSLLLFVLTACTDGDVDPKPIDSDTDVPATVDTEPPDTDCPDADGDGHACDDCDDDNPDIYPGAEEICDGRDSDCDDLTPNGESTLGGVPACLACAEAGFWPDVRDASDTADLLARLTERTSTNGLCVYRTTIDFLFVELDNHGGEVEGVYTGFRLAVDGDRPDSNIMNTEHTWPRADGGGEGQRECDLHHLFPTASDANQARGSLPFGMVDRGIDWSEGGSRRGVDTSGTEVFEPRPAHQGNTARAMMYMALRYDLTLSSTERALFRAWHDDDPASAEDHARDHAIAAYQGNHNPFVACPEVAGLLVDAL